MFTNDELRTQLRSSGLRCTNARLAVMAVLDQAERPLSHTEVVQRIDSQLGHQATIYRTLVSLVEAKLTRVASRAAGIDRYELSSGNESSMARHVHPHFVCNQCGVVSCLPEALISINTDQSWAKWLPLIETAEFQLVGNCLECRA